MNTELKRSSMTFELKDGSLLHISKEDVKEIAFKILAEGLCTLPGKFVLLAEGDTTLKKAQFLFDVLKTEKNINQEIRDNYLKRIGELVSESKDTYKGSDEKEYILNS